MSARSTRRSPTAGRCRRAGATIALLGVLVVPTAASAAEAPTPPPPPPASAPASPTAVPAPDGPDLVGDLLPVGVLALVVGGVAGFELSRRGL